MTLKEFSNEFDVLYNNIMSNAAPGLNEYEKSVFLTQAQEEFVIGIYAGRIQQYGSFEETQELKRYLDALIVSATLYPNTNSVLDQGNKAFTVPNENLFTVYERARSGTSPNVVEYLINSITHDQYEYTKKNPFKGILSGRVLSLSKNSNEVELIPPNGVTLTEYFIRYIKVPKPIILTDLTTINATIKGISTATNCELHNSTHLPILKIAVQKAALAYKQ